MLIIEKLHNESFAPVSIELRGGECLVVQGSSGSGKTRFLRAIADLDAAGGEITLNSKVRSDMPASMWRRMVRFVAAEAAWWGANVRAHFEDHPLSLELMGSLDLAERLLDAPLNELSTGERQRFAFLRAICDQPDVLLLDEPTSALDERSAINVEGLIASEIERGAIVLIVTHSERQAKLFGPKCLRFEHGSAALVEIE